MPDDTITLISTTDSPEQVQEALTQKPAETETAETETETPEQKDEREASEAGRTLGERGAKRKKKIEEEINELTGRKHSVRRDVEAEEARLEELRRQRQELEPKQPEPDAKAKAPAAKAQETPGRPEPKLDAVNDDGNAKYATYEDYLSDHAVWTREEAVSAARQVIDQEKTADRERIERESASRAVNERLAKYNSDLETFKKTHADFDAAFEDAKEAVQSALVAIGPHALKVIDGFTVFDAEDGPALTYYLLKRPDELKAIALKAPQQQVVHLARLEERIRQGSAKKPGSPPATAPETKAPEPIRPVGSGPTATTVSDEESYQDYRARRERELRARRGY